MISADVWKQIKEMKRQGKGKKTIARELGISRNTVRRYWDSESPPKYKRRRIRESVVNS